MLSPSRVRAFSLIEVLLALFLFGITAVVFSQSFTNRLRALAKTAPKQTLEEDLTLVPPSGATDP